MKLKNLVTCVVLLAFGCGEDDKKGKSRPQPAGEDVVPFQLNLAEHGVQSFKDLPVEKRCDGIGEFFNFVVKKYLDPQVVLVEHDRELYKDKFDCHSTDSYPFPADRYTRNLSLMAGRQQISFSIDIRSVSYGFISQIDRVKISSSVYMSDYSNYKNNFGANITAFERTLEAWLNGFSTSTWTFLGKSQYEFIKDQTTKYGIDGEPFTAFVKGFSFIAPERALESGLDLSKRMIAFQFEPSVTGEYTGTVKFTMASDEVFKSIDFTGAIIQSPFLGCITLKCLQESTIIYEFYGANLFLTVNDALMKSRYTEFVYSFESRYPPTAVRVQ